MSKLKLAKKEHQLNAVKHARSGLELKIMEYESEIERIKDNLVIQDKEVNKLKKELEELKGE